MRQDGWWASPLAAAQAEFRAGRLDAAVEAATTALTLRNPAGDPEVRRRAMAVLAAVHAIRGAEQACRAAAAHTGSDAAVTLLELGTGQCDRIVARHPSPGPDPVRWTADLLEAYLRAREPLPVRLAPALELRAGATGRPLRDAVAARMAAQATSGPRGIEWFEVALRRHADAGGPFERGRTHMAFGERLRRDGLRVRARDQLHAAAAIFDDMGARPWSARACSELSVSAGRAVRCVQPDRLTPQESQVARAVATGMTNREVATTLFVSVKTVEFHLGNIYRKLGVRNRTQLARTASVSLV